MFPFQPADHRVWPGKLFPSAPGDCRWCGTTLLKSDGSVNRRRRFCNIDCRREYELRCDPKKMRRFIYYRDMGMCKSCGEIYNEFSDDGWECDHVKPLWAANGDWTYWDPDNCRLLCRDPCHKRKTRSDMRHYRRVQNNRH